jgi:hypothetical protein
MDEEALDDDDEDDLTGVDVAVPGVVAVVDVVDVAPVVTAGVVVGDTNDDGFAASTCDENVKLN